jgi:MFS family permease
MGAAGLVTGPANTFVFYFSETVRGLPPSTMAVAVVAAGPLGLIGLVAGRWAADHLGRRLSSGSSLAAIAGAAILTYNVPGYGVVAGYLLAIFSASVYTPGSGAMSAELFPTSCRSTAAGWLTASGVIGAVAGLGLFGFLADVLGGFGKASVALALPVMLLSTLYMLLPETRGVDLDSSPDLAGPLYPQL